MSMGLIAGAGTVLYNSNGWYVCTNGVVVSITARVKTGSGSWDSVSCPYVLPQEFRPKAGINAHVATQNGGSITGVMFVNTDGTIVVGNQGGSGSDGTRMGSVCYVVA
jgi:hypothetical protein